LEDQGETAEQYIKQKKYSRIVGMSHIPYDKSAPKEYCKPEGGHGRAEPDAHINPSGQDVGLVLCPDVYSKDQTSSVKHVTKNIHRQIPPRRLAFCGGGVRCVAHIGVLKALKANGLLTCVKEVTGISAGAFFALLYVLEYTIEQMERLGTEMDFSTLGTIDPEDILLFPLTFGLNSGEAIERLIASILKQKGFSPDVTMGQLPGIGFRCYATELQTTKIKELSAKSTPNMKVITAVRASMSFPLMFSPVKDGDSLLVDGGLLHNLPLVFLTEHEIQETLCVFFVVEPRVFAEPVEEVLDFVKYMYEAAIDMRNRPYLKKYREQLILIDTGDCNGLDFSESSTSRTKLIEKGFITTEKFLYHRRQPGRRFSVS
jgi:predicted acylesterase/phospholipase RssA